MEEFIRQEMLVGKDGQQKLAQSRVAVFGIGGVGGFACEGLARAGIGTLHLFDHDTVEQSNLNRQIVALRSTLGKNKAEVMAARIADINPACAVRACPVFYLPENADDYPLDGYDYVVDAVDTVTAKLEIARRTQMAGVPLVSAMGTGNKMRPELLEVGLLFKTSVCPLARVMRKEAKDRGLGDIEVVYSTEPPQNPQQAPQPGRGGKVPPGSVSFVPAAAGMMLASVVVRRLLGME